MTVIGNVCVLCLYRVGRDSSVGKATRYGLDGLGVEHRWGEVFRTNLYRPWDPPSLHRACFPGLKWLGMVLTSHLPLAPRLKKNRAILLLPLWACTSVNFPFTGFVLSNYRGAESFIYETRHSFVFFGTQCDALIVYTLVFGVFLVNL
jgi:hypothetical protein